jgi:uncharacterized damage-inducible protein DinB
VIDPRYPIGKLVRKSVLSPEARNAAIATIAALPFQLADAVRGLDQSQLDTSYRDGGWSVRQVVHHLADSHVNAYVRTKLLLTENAPVVKVWDEEAWAQLSDGKHSAIGSSLLLATSVHERWAHCLRACKAEDFARTLMHPDNGAMTLDDLLSIYEWHGKHHVAHITTLRAKMGW